jgi:hypothetical protein
MALQWPAGRAACRLMQGSEALQGARQHCGQPSCQCTTVTNSLGDGGTEYPVVAGAPLCPLSKGTCCGWALHIVPHPLLALCRLLCGTEVKRQPRISLDCLIK